MSSAQLSHRVASEVRAEMARQWRTQTWLAAQLGVAPASISRKINGERAFNLDELERIARLLGVTVHSFVKSDAISVERSA